MSNDHLPQRTPRGVALAALAALAAAQQPFTPPRSPIIPSEVLPYPVSMTTGSSAALISPSFTITCMMSSGGGPCPDPIAAAASRAEDTMFFAGSPDTPATGARVISGIQILLDFNASLQWGVNESYALTVPTQGVATIAAPNQWGALRALESFTQLAIWQGVDAGATQYVITNTPINIVDAPRFPWRGFLIDTSFNFVTKTAIKGVLDSMAYAKLNILHWHATDDPSWPIESSTFPNFTAYGAYSSLAKYSIADQVEIFSYAWERGIMILIELDMPGHAEIWQAGNPNYVIPCAGGQTLLNPLPSSGIYDVIRALFVEYTTRFPGLPFIHSGGDEVTTLACWAQDPNVVAFMAANNISDVNALRNYFQVQVQEVANALGLTMLMWEEVYRAGYEFLPTSVVTPWITPDVAMNATANGTRVVNYYSYYLDQQVPPGRDPPAPLGQTYYYWIDTWATFYAYDPVVSAGIAPENADMVLGGTAPMWGENVDSSNILARAWPRAAAIAERLWSPPAFNNTFDFDEVEARLEHFRCHLAQRGIPAGPFSVASDHGFCWSPSFLPPPPGPAPVAPVTNGLRSDGVFAVAIGSAIGGALVTFMFLSGNLCSLLSRVGGSSMGTPAADDVRRPLLSGSNSGRPATQMTSVNRDGQGVKGEEEWK